MLGKLINTLVILVCLSLFCGLMYVLHKKEVREEKACAAQGMVLVKTRGHNYCTTGFRP